MKKETPIIFSTLMVQAILSRTKTQTRRIIKPQPDDSGLWNDDKYPRGLDSLLTGWNGVTDDTAESKEFKCPYGKVSDILWVRETFLILPPNMVFYKADIENKATGKWKPSIFMPKIACRIRLKITNIRVEKLQDISEEDAIAEGIIAVQRPGGFGFGLKKEWDYKFPLHERTPIDAYRMLWDKINGKHSWDTNPWVWVIEFKIL